MYMDALIKSGFENVESYHHDYNVVMPEEEWYGMIRQRFWSNFAPFSDGEVEEGVEEVRCKYGGGGSISFPDRIVFIVAVK